MRAPFLVLALLLVPSLAAAQTAQTAQSAQIAFVERRGLLEADAQCRLFEPPVRAALLAGAGQARGQLLGGGWTRTQLEDLEQAAVRAARARACDDARTAAAAQQARAGFTAWSRMSAMEFPGWDRAWSARRIPDAAGWLLRQNPPGLDGAFGVRERDGAQELALVFALAPNETAPSSAQLVMRDPQRARASLRDVPGRTAQGLEAGAPSAASAQRFWANARLVGAAQREIAFVFPDAAFEAMMLLDPREAVELRVGDGPSARRILVEVGDIAAARAFLALQAR